MSTMRYCPYCGGQLAERLLETEDRPRLVCESCQNVVYENPRIVVAALPVNDHGVVLLRRGNEPRKGTWTFPGGYMELGESIEEAAIRETKEEVDLDIEPVSLLGIYSRPEVGVVVVVYVARILGGRPQLSREALEVAEFPPEQIPWSDLSFPSTIWALEDWCRGVRSADCGMRGTADLGTRSAERR